MPAARQSLLLPWLLAFKAFSTPVAFGVTALVNDGKGRVLLVRQRYLSGWHLPGGGVGRGEPPADAIIRELQEEVGLQSWDPPALQGLYTRAVGLATNVVALYRVPGARIAFRPNREIAEITWASPSAPPDNCTRGTLRRLEELTGRVPASSYW